nr:hypothetical protein [uncultured Methanoregula sp.]
MSKEEEKKTFHGIALFLLLAGIIGIIAIIALGITGPLGIEERFASAVGQQPGDAVHEDDGGGFSIEGQPLIYGAFLVILILVCIFMYRKFRI